jgi:O-antigen ligase
MLPMRRWVAWAGIALLAAYLVFIGGGWLGIYRSDLRTLTVALAGVVLAIWGVVAWRDPAWRPRSVLAPALLVCGASLAISTAFSRQPRISLEYLGYAVLLFALYLLLVRLMADPFFRARLVALAALMFVALSVEFIGGVVLLWVGWWQTAGAIAQPPLRPAFIGLSYGNPSAVLTMVALLAVPAGAIWATGRARLPVLALIAIVVGTVAILSGSRAGWLALAVALGAGGLVLLSRPSTRAWARGRWQALRDRRWRQWLLLGLLAGLVAVVTVGVYVAPAILRRVEAGGEDLRATFAVVSLRLFLESPIVGTGPGTWVIERIAATGSNEIDYYIPHAHDVPLQTLAELGIVGALAGVVIIVAVGRLLRSALADSDPSRRWLAALTSLGLLYFAVHQLLDFYPNMPAVLFVAALPVAWLDATRPSNASPRPVGAPRGLPRALGLLTALACAVAVVGLQLTELPARQVEAATAAANEGDWQRAWELARTASAEDPDVSPYSFTAGLAAAHLGDLTAARDDFDRVVGRDDLPYAWLNLAAVNAQLGDRDRAVGDLHRALRLGWQRADVAMAAGALALDLADTDDAIEGLAGAVAARADLAADPWFQAAPSRLALYPAVIDRAIELIMVLRPEDAWTIPLMAGDAPGSRALAPKAQDPVLAASIIDAWAGDASATATLLDACGREPLRLDRLTWCARLADRKGDQGEASRFRTLAEVISPGSSLGTFDLRVTASDEARDVAVHPTAYWWAIYTYRRPIPDDVLVPGLVHLVPE